jgi:ribosomal protein S18 acetylase RimI-like enzyme
MTTQDIRIVEIDARRIGELRDLWLALHRHHRGIGSRPLVDDDESSWSRRRATYLGWLGEGAGLILGAERDGQMVGYVAVHLHDGPDDTFPLGERWAEIYSLSVAPEARGVGIGSRLLDAVDERLAEIGIVDLAVAAMVENESARALYERRGFRAREVVLYRFGSER